MSDNFESIIDQDWSELARDDGTITDEFGTYSATLFSQDGTQTLETEVENISYSPEVNATKGLSVDVEPFSELEGEAFLGGIVDVFVNDKPLFSGEINKIQTHQNDDGFYSIEAEPPGKKLRDETVDIQSDNFILLDRMAKIIDKYNDWDSEHFGKVGTSDEEIPYLKNVFSQLSDDARSVDISDSKIVYSGFSQEVYIHDFDGTLEYTLSQSTDFVTSSAVSSDYVAYGGFDENVYVHNLSDGSLEYTLSEGILGIEAVGISDDQKYIAYSQADTVYVHNLSDGSLEYTLSEQDSGQVNRDMDISETKIVYGTFEVSGGGLAFVHDLSDGSLLYEFTKADDDVQSVAISESEVIYGSSDTKLYKHDLSDGSLFGQIEINNGIFSCDLNNSEIVLIQESNINVYDLNSLEFLYEIDDITQNILTDLSINDDFIAYSSEDNNVYLNFINSINKIDDRVLQSNINKSTVTYSNVGDNLSQLDTLYVKCNTQSNSIDVTVDDGTTSETRTLSGLNTGTFGDWEKLTFDISSTGRYSIEFEMDNDTILYDWIALTESKLERDVEPEVADLNLEDENIQSAFDNASFQDVLNITDTEPFVIENNKLKSLQTGFVQEAETDRTATLVSRSDFSDGEGVLIGNDQEETRITIDLDYETSNLAFYARLVYTGSDSDSRNLIIEESGVENDIIAPTNLEWVGTSLPDTYAPGEYIFTLTPNPQLDFGEAEIDMVAVVDDQYTYNFDNTLNEPNGYLDGPSPYPSSNYPELEFNEQIFSDVVSEATVETTVNDPNGLKEIGLSFNSGSTYLTEENVSNIIKENVSTTSSVQTRIKTGGYTPNGTPQNETPRLNYEGQNIDLYDLFVDTIDIEVLFDKEITGNRLKSLTDLADNSQTFYRWEGNQAKLFKSGSRNTNIDLRKESIESSVGIQDVYASCEVIGKDGISSGVIEADNAPDYVDRHKEIRDPDIETEREAQRRANSFLAENSTIEYEGSISTLPTLAPLGEFIDGSKFNHGQDMFIDSVRYSKRRSDIDFGKKKQFKDEILKLDRDTISTNTRGTR